MGWPNKTNKKLFIGIDIKGAGFGLAQKRNRGRNINKRAFLRTQIELIDELFCLQ